MQPAMFSHHILVIGDLQTPEFAAPLAELPTQARATFIGDMQGAHHWLSSGEHVPIVIALLQRYPGELQDSDLDELRRQAPLARMVVIAGSWCEGEKRSGHIPEGVERIYWHQWRDRIAASAAIFRAADTPGTLPPLTATEDDRVLAAERRTYPPRCIVVISREREAAQSLVDACRHLGFDAEVETNSIAYAQTTASAQADVLLWDANMRAVVDPHQVEAIRRTRQMPVIALVGFPRIDVVERARAAGVHAVVSKPVMLPDLGEALARAAAEVSHSAV